MSTQLESTHKTGTAEPRFVRAQVIASAVDLNPRTILLMAQQGRISSIRIGTSVRFDYNQVMGELLGERAAK
jgi:hypothetical protein